VHKQIQYVEQPYALCARIGIAVNVGVTVSLPSHIKTTQATVFHDPVAWVGFL